MKKYKNIQEIKSHNSQIGELFFKDNVMDYWNSRIESKVLYDNYFVTSESDQGKRRYTLRQCYNGSIYTIGDFFKYTTKDAVLNFLEEVIISKKFKIGYRVSSDSAL